ncbi:MAG: UbiA family prenyltransferase [Candidatus Caldatribacteriota bacterium]|nr:UbiA family prenyltransferase [Atribacterota bacterium]MDD3031466.1 UbiA family prenyltransferase [Atribacterota bacterium]MDD3641063.1 UbiA family prenyltransferase [Atribacterota bacterium]MDD4289143.1 UbiA family prenyltransferase [Atribacterota bacterium]MDI9596263.1 UbiA family prenyltransferase [Atribacterota bacterium]
MINRFLSFIEIKTKITSIFAFLLALAYLFYIQQPINWRLTVIFFASMFIFDLTTTSINNYIDTKTNDQKLQFKRKTALLILFLLLSISTLLGLYLAILTDLVVLFLGGLCFLTGIFYTFGPIPISRLPLGEILSGLFYGFFIPFIMLYINMPEGTYLTYGLNYEPLSIFISLNIMPIITIILLSAAPVCTTANIMLANNICDLEKDVKVKRYTLPYYIGKKSLFLFAWLYYIIYITTILMVFLKILPPLVLLFILTLFIVQKNVKQFFKLQDKERTFPLSIKNYIIIMGSNVFLIFLSGLL